jgi:alkanesulfonate monooxygenase SsuD/methylene tetrahydromethanopterin reductase-like flavin-dependent oxidoreductase (luciferase family)
VAGCAPITENINILAAIRCGEMQPIMLARTVATLDHMLKGRLTLNVISSDFPGPEGTQSLSLSKIAGSGSDPQASLDGR